jgi:siderophore synthetase component
MKYDDAEHTTEEVSLPPEQVAESATIHSFVNCYLRETREYERREATAFPSIAEITDCDTVIRSELTELGLDLLLPVRYYSQTGRHLFELPVYYSSNGGGDRERNGDREGNRDWVALDYATLASLVIRKLSFTQSGDDGGDELLLRVIRSCHNIARYVEARRDDTDQLYGFDTSFLASEQSLVFGHLLHPTPKSRQGIAPRDASTYAPELQGSFQLHYFGASPEIVAHGSAREESAAEWVKQELRGDPDVSKAFVAEHVESDRVLIPIHPWQAEYVLDQPHVQREIDSGRLEYLGGHGREFYPTSSVRTLYNPDSAFMVKGSLHVKITNSVRTNKQPELMRGVAISELLDTELGDQLRERFPDFRVIRDPAYLTLDITDEESGFEIVLRDNPFQNETETHATPVVALCQDHLNPSGDTTHSRLGHIIRTLADREGRSTAAVSEEWFRQYLAVSLRPVLWLYLTHGIGVEAHQQNSVLALDEGYPDRFYYRDNQGYYFCESTYAAVDEFLPGVGERADTICPDEIADERIRYYVVLNNALGLINAFGCAGLIDERRLLGILRDELDTLREFDREESNLLEPLLTSRTVPCKANLLTRFHGMDELEASLENQSVYTEIDNPLVTGVDSV